MKKALAAVAATLVLALAAPASADPPIVGGVVVCFKFNGKPFCLIVPRDFQPPGPGHGSLPKNWYAKDLYRDGPWR